MEVSYVCLFGQGSAESFSERKSSHQLGVVVLIAIKSHRCSMASLNHKFTKKFFEVLGKEGDSAALEYFRDGVFPNGLSQPPDATAESFVNSAEWNSREVPLISVPEGTCFGRLAPVDKFKKDSGEVEPLSAGS